MPETSLRIQKLLKVIPPMTNAQIARKIGRPDAAGEARVEKERQRLSGLPECYCGGLFDMCPICLRRQGDVL